MAEIQDLLVTDASNTARWPENMPFSGVNDAGRSDEGILARWYKDTDASVVSSGAANAFAATSNRTIAAYFNNLTFTFTANFTNTAAATLNLNGLGAKGIKRFNGTDLAAGDITSGQPVTVIYKSSPDIWYMMTAAAALATAITTFADFNENASPGNPAADVGRFYAVDNLGTTRMAYRDSSGTETILGVVATQAQMEAASSIIGPSTPGRQHFHPGHPKAGGLLDVSGTPVFQRDYGIASVTDQTNKYLINFDTAFSDTTYWCASWVRNPGGSTVGLCSAATTGGTKTTSTFLVWVIASSSGSSIASSEVGISFWGDYP